AAPPAPAPRRPVRRALRRRAEPRVRGPRHRAHHRRRARGLLHLRRGGALAGQQLLRGARQRRHRPRVYGRSVVLCRQGEGLRRRHRRQRVPPLRRGGDPHGVAAGRRARQPRLLRRRDQEHLSRGERWHRSERRAAPGRPAARRRQGQGRPARADLGRRQRPGLREHRRRLPAGVRHQEHAVQRDRAGQTRRRQAQGHRRRREGDRRGTCGDGPGGLRTRRLPPHPADVPERRPAGGRNALHRERPGPGERLPVSGRRPHLGPRQRLAADRRGGQDRGDQPRCRAARPRRRLPGQGALRPDHRAGRSAPPAVTGRERMGALPRRERRSAGRPAGGLPPQRLRPDGPRLLRGPGVRPAGRRLQVHQHAGQGARGDDGRADRDVRRPGTGQGHTPAAPRRPAEGAPIGPDLCDVQRPRRRQAGPRRRGPLRRPPRPDRHERPRRALRAARTRKGLRGRQALGLPQQRHPDGPRPARGTL
ncbi:MAG: hypothetical protein AVDCRST_MAG53-1755, partial [uncultured Solirubrobacteraceae bacterium]